MNSPNVKDKTEEEKFITLKYLTSATLKFTEELNTGEYKFKRGDSLKPFTTAYHLKTSLEGALASIKLLLLDLKNDTLWGTSSNDN